MKSVIAAPAWARPFALCALAASSALAALAAQAQESYKVGIVSFLSGQAAESFGVPAVKIGRAHV